MQKIIFLAPPISAVNVVNTFKVSAVDYAEKIGSVSRFFVSYSLELRRNLRTFVLLN